VLKDMKASGSEILSTDAWEDEAVTLGEAVNFEKFTLEVKASSGRLEVILNHTDSVVFEDIHMEKWGVFENYFKAGNYLITKDAAAFASVKYYELEITHEP
ncbi:MAG: polysaccharide lyase family 7 protein, partial [Bacteroidota bacterium]